MIKLFILFQHIDLALPSSQKYKIVSNWLKDVFGKLKTEPKQYSLILERIAMQYYLYFFNIPQYLPPSYKDSNFYLDKHAVAMRKNSEMEFAINKW